jgi:antitoxin HicB
MQYPALVEPAKEGGYVVTFPDFPWGITQGDDENEVNEMAVDALCTMIQECIRKSEPVPSPGKHRGRRFRSIRLPALQAAKTELYREFLASGIRKAELANRLGMSKTSVDRLFDLNQHSRLDHIEAAFTALGKVLSIEIRDAA